MAKHKWYKEICAWADGAEIEKWMLNDTWQVESRPSWYDHENYRIKPQHKEPQYLYVYKMMTNEGLKIQFWDSKTYRDESYLGKIKLEVDDE